MSDVCRETIRNGVLQCHGEDGRDSRSTVLVIEPDVERVSAICIVYLTK